MLSLPLLLGACSSLFFDDEELAPQRIQVQEQQEPDPDYPTLASVPEQVPQPSATEQRQELLEGLSADRQNARYSDQPLTPESVAAEAGADSDAAYPPPPLVDPAAEDATRSQTAANLPSAPPPPIQEPAARDTAELDEPPMPPPPAAAEQSAQGDFTAPPPPLVTAAAPSEPPAVPAPPSMNGSLSDASMSDSGDTVYPAPTGLLQERAFQQQAQATQRLQQIVAERRAFDEQARQQALEQQWQREQLIQQQQAQLRYPAAYRQQAAVPAVPAAPAVYPGQQVNPLVGAPVGAGQLVGLIYFGHGSAQLDGRDRQVLEQVVALQQSQGRGLRVVGHASARIDAPDMAQHVEKNQVMSLQRAEAVARALVAMGADSSRISVGGAGDAQPVFHEFTSTGEAGNRRVEIFLE